MLAAERRSVILEKIHQDKKVLVAELSKEFEVSEETIRRDLDRLEQEGRVIKSYGGAVLNEKNNIDLPFNIRWKSNPMGKQKIAELVSREIEDGDHIFLDASTTAVFIAKNIKEKKNLTIITNSIENLLELSDVKDWNIISTGGDLDVSSMSLMGKRAFDAVSSFNADKVFFSCKGFDVAKGVTDGREDIAGIKLAMINSAKKIYLAVDSSKFDMVAFSGICELSKVDCVITDKKPEEKWIKLFEKNNVRCVFPA